MIENADSLNVFLQDISLFLLSDIKDCEQKGLLYSTFPKELDLSVLFDSTIEISAQAKILTEPVIKILNNLKSVDIGITSYSLSMVGQIIAKTQINILGTSYRAKNNFKLKLSDFTAQNIIAMGESSAYGISNNSK